MFRDVLADYDAFFAHGPGAMCWGFDKQGRRMLHFLAPADAPRGWEAACIYCQTNGRDWTVPGHVNGWDGDLERPTFHPSVWLRNKRGWHGYIERGNLRAC